MIEKLCSQSPAGLFQASHRPASPNIGWLTRGKRDGALSGLRHSEYPEIGTRQRRLCSGTRQRLLFSRFSHLALKVARFGSGPAEPKPIRPQRIPTNSRAKVSRLCRMTGWVVLGAML